MNTYSNGYEDISVEVIDFNMDIARHAWNCYRMTWKELQNVEYNMNDPRCIEALTNIVKMRALPMPREQALITLYVLLRLQDNVKLHSMSSLKCQDRSSIMSSFL